MCRLCDIGKVLEEANSDEDAFAVLEEETFDTVQDSISKDDVYHFLLRKYRDEAILNMDENSFNNLLKEMEEAGRATPSVPGQEKLDLIMRKKSLH